MAEQTGKKISAPRVVLYTRRGCHLCDEAQRVLERHGLAPDCIDIDGDPSVKARFDTCVPVVEIEGKIRFRGVVHPLLLRRIILHGFGAGDHDHARAVVPGRG